MTRPKRSSAAWKAACASASDDWETRSAEMHDGQARHTVPVHMAHDGGDNAAEAVEPTPPQAATLPKREGGREGG